MGRIWIKAVCAFAIVAAPLVGVTAAGASGSATLSVQDFMFSPSTLTIAVGTTVTVTNDGATTHTWASDPGSAQAWNSGNINPGASYSVAFNTLGTFGYHCNIHPFMTGRIVVTGAPVTTAPPTTTPATTTPTSAAAGANPPTSGAAAAAAPVARPTVLPHTGASKAGALTVVAVALTLAGTALLFVSSTVQRRRRRLGP